MGEGRRGTAVRRAKFLEEGRVGHGRAGKDTRGTGEGGGGGGSMAGVAVVDGVMVSGSVAGVTPAWGMAGRITTAPGFRGGGAHGIPSWRQRVSTQTPTLLVAAARVAVGCLRLSQQTHSVHGRGYARHSTAGYLSQLTTECLRLSQRTLPPFMGSAVTHDTTPTAISRDKRHDTHRRGSK